MDIELNRLTAVDVPVRGEVRPADEGGPGQPGTWVRFPEPLRIDARARRQGTAVLVAGAIDGEVRLQCGRCLGPVAWPVHLEFEARFAEQSAAPAPARSSRRDVEEDDEDGIQLAQDDLDVSFLPAGAHAIPVTDIVREQVLLDVPLRPLCSESCAGLCARCGADLNQGPCGCPEETDAQVDARLAALAEIRKKLESDKN